jgi:recombination protein RecA
LEIAEKLAESGEVDIIVVDSVAALVPKAELEGELEDHHPGAQARLMSKGLRRIKGVANKTNTAIVFTNQMREKIGIAYGNPEVTPGGRALKFYSTVRIEIRRLEGIRKAGEAPKGNRVRAKVVKNKVAPPFRNAEFSIIFGEGIDRIDSIIDASEQLGVVERAGSHYKYNGKSYNGREKFGGFLESDQQIFADIEQKVMSAFNTKMGRAEEPTESKPGDPKPA